MKILITGSTGFIGQHVVSWLIKNSYNVIASSTREDKASVFAWYNKVEFLPGNYYLHDENYYLKFDKPDILIHLAWNGLPNYTELFHMEKNLPAEIKFLSSFIQSGHTKVVVIGTCYEYGLCNGCLSESDLSNPVTSYGIAKDTLRKYIEYSSQKNTNKWNWIRLFYLFGPGQTRNSLITQLDSAISRGDKYFPMSGGEQIRDFLHVADVAKYICKIALQDDYSGIVNCCSGSPISVRRFVENYIRNMGSDMKIELGKYPYLPYEPMAFWGDTKRLNDILQSE